MKLSHGQDLYAAILLILSAIVIWGGIAWMLIRMAWIAIAAG
jgi:hypothetical protein